MKLIGLKEAKARLSEFVEHAQRDRILITRRGKPAALVIGVEGEDLEQVLLGNDAGFWKMIQKRRQREAALTSDDVRRSFGIPLRSESRKSSAAKPKRQPPRPTKGKGQRR
jgi:prevent-host-death family protein